MNLWWLSFCDDDLPKGEQFLGACVVPGADMVMAVKMAWRLGCNPGGEVRGLLVPPEIEPLIPQGWQGRLLTKQQCKQFDQMLGALLPN